MASKLKQALIKYVKESTPSKSILPDLEKAIPELRLKTSCETKLEGDLKFYPVDKSREESPAVFNDFKLQQSELQVGETSRHIRINNVSDNGKKLHFEINTSDFIKDVLNSNPIEIETFRKRKKMLVEFSSPNIAKEFHVGHFRSTMIGNFVANIVKKAGNDVVKINYLGDWGTQFGLLITGIELLGYTEESLNSDTIQKLNKAYVHANKIAAGDEKIEVKAREIFQRLENGDKEITKKWQQLKEWSINDLEQLYKRLDVEFHEYDWESLYNSKKAEPLLKELGKKGILSDDEEGRKIVQVNGNPVPLLKSDGTTLYLLRDVLAFFDRRSRHKFDKSYYVVDYSQGKHFTNLKSICELIEPGSSHQINHVQIGRILKMSTRTGTNILLRDVLVEARERMYENQVKSKTTKGFASPETAEILGRSALVVYDHQQGRERHYEFKWDTALNSGAKSGIRLQYVHCRLCSLIKNAKEEIAKECDPSSITEPAAVRLVLNIARFEGAVDLAAMRLEPAFLTEYLFELTSSINVAFSQLSVKNTDPHLASQRLYLFKISRLVIAEGLRLLGLPALEEM